MEDLRPDFEENRAIRPGGNLGRADSGDIAPVFVKVRSAKARRRTFPTGDLINPARRIIGDQANQASLRSSGVLSRR